MKLKREYNYDLLRVVSMIAVIMIHVSSAWVSGFSKYIADGGALSGLLHPVAACIYDALSRFAVPCFIMLSGAFVLDSDKTADYKEFYQKSLMKLGAPTIIFSILYILYRIPLCFLYVKFFAERTVFIEMLKLIYEIIAGLPFYHMWYMYMLIVVYLLAPIVVRFKDSISYGRFRKAAFIFLVMASISRWTTENVRLSWDLGQAFEYLGYFMVGYVIRKDLQKNNLKGLMLIAVGTLIETATAFAKYKFQIADGIAESELKYGIFSPYSPPTVAASLLIFAGFTMLQVKYNKHIEKLADMSFIIYLFHAGVWDFFCKFMYIIKGRDYLTKLNNIYWIPIFVITVLAISAVLTVIYNNLERRFLCRKQKQSRTAK